MKVINKIAFLVHEPTMFVHYASVWAEMDRNTFVIVLLGVFEKDGKGEHGTKDFLSKVGDLGYEVTYLDDLVANKIKYQYVVSNHILGGRSSGPATFNQVALEHFKRAIKQALNVFNFCTGREKRYLVKSLGPIQYPPLQAGIKQIRFMYGADISDAWSLDEWNDIYDLFLCHGPNDEMHLKKRFRGKTAIMGYPRYDGYFSQNLNIDDVIAEFDVDRTKKTILWMPTYDMYGDSLCSIIPFAKIISKLMMEYNVIVRPHPISLRNDIDAMKILVSLGYKIDRDVTRNMNKLFKLADFVFCDHGGSAFGALYLGKKIVFLNSPNFNKSLMAKNSSNLELRKYFPNISVDEGSSLDELLSNSGLWDELMMQSKTLSNKFFSDFRGTSSSQAAKILGHLTDI